VIPPVSPCGLAVDRLRACYEQDVKFYKDSDELTRIRWYWVDDAPFLPVPTIFGSYVWEDDNGPRSGMNRGTVFQGEQVSSEAVYASGAAPFPAGVPLGRYCGTPSQWLGDLELARDGEATTDGEGRPTCCGAIPPPPADACANGTRETAESYLITCPVPISGAVPIAALGGFHQVQRDSGSGLPCSWLGSPVTFVPPILRWRITISAVDFLRVGFMQGGTFRVLATVADWDSTLPIDIPITSTFGGTWPPTLTLEPLQP